MELALMDKRRGNKARDHAFSRPAIDSNLLIQAPRPSLLRPTSFWRTHPRSATTAPAYSPSSHLVRRATFVAAGLEGEIMMHNNASASALAMAVEGRTSSIVCVPGMPGL
ncbi:hypothetical protein SISSUDRAFT_104454 [Sistotremastrum suecicum HHB10207 ss-3]|uniref:Uncharacterized protein n=1 Tax=Sistotremastrum suecicum HHB10207 ss-3 TaxID=1314776 RepID=A0A166B465_9AGAM|nr:hypothetical protein SISSUDRAFT_104454 [Sistotremastrum suecicum HHB10207 ss-3]